MEFHTVPAKGWRIAMGRAAGVGPLLVYLHGLGCAGSQDWPPVAAAPALAGRASLWVDLPGFGRSDRPSGFSYDLADQADLLTELLAPGAGVVPAGTPIALIGHSMGGTLAVLVAERLIAARRPPVALVLAEAILNPGDAATSARVAAKSEARFVSAWPRWVQAFPSPFYREEMRLADPTAYYCTAVSLMRHSEQILERFLALPVPTKGFIAGGRSDPPIHRTARRLAAAGLPIATVPGSGHGFSEDDPAGLAAAIAGFVTAH
ncbi:MAG: hypothetical protein JWN15_2425 [Firmicutes bacterium]|nr:hypothetical protein [Bacillota bacterium]